MKTLQEFNRKFKNGNFIHLATVQCLPNIVFQLLLRNILTTFLYHRFNPEQHFLHIIKKVSTKVPTEICCRKQVNSLVEKQQYGHFTSYIVTLVQAWVY